LMPPRNTPKGSLLVQATRQRTFFDKHLVLRSTPLIWMMSKAYIIVAPYTQSKFHEIWRDVWEHLKCIYGNT
jgi:hypothetical protein